MKKNFFVPVLGVLLAIIITTIMDATGSSMFSALPLIVLLVIFWKGERITTKELGFTAGNWQAYPIAVYYPFIIIGGLTSLAFILGLTETSDTDWGKFTTNFLLMSVTGIIMVTITEEGFFRGWLWASLKKRGVSNLTVLIVTSLAFAVWHISVVSFDTGFAPPSHQIPVYLVNVIFMGFVWGSIRLASDSVFAASVSHAVWNAMAYGLFGFGTDPAALGIVDKTYVGPETGILGLIASFLFSMYMFIYLRKRGHFRS